MSQELSTFEDGSIYPNFTNKDYVVDKPDDMALDRRGRGKTGRTHRPYTDAEKMTICMLRGKGLSNEEIGEKLHRSHESIKTVLRNVELQSKRMGLNFDWREDVREKAVHAVRAGLVHEEDPYKRAGIGIQALKGLGEFEAENSINIATLVGQIPENMRDRYITTEADPNLITAEVVNGESE